MGIYKATDTNAFAKIAAKNSIDSSVIPLNGVHALTRNAGGIITSKEVGRNYSNSAILYADNWVQAGKEYQYTVTDENVYYASLVYAYPIGDTQAAGPIRKQDNMIVGEGYFVIRALAIPERDISIGYTVVPIPELAGKFFFECSGIYEAVESINPNAGTRRGYIRFLSDGILRCLSNATLDLFGVGAGGGSGIHGSYQTCGSGGGYTSNVFGVNVRAADELLITIGYCPGVASRGNPTTITRNDIALLSALGGYPGAANGGGNGGSGGGGGGDTVGIGGVGGSNGGNGVARTFPGGTGQGFTTRPFLGDVLPFSNTASFLFGAGGGGRSGSGGAGGSYGGGTAVGDGSGGLDNTGGGAGGVLKGSAGHFGGSGTAFIRWGDWSS